MLYTKIIRDKISIAAEIKYLNLKQKNFEYTLIEIEHGGEIRFIIKLYNKHQYLSEYYLVDNTFSCIELEIQYFEEFYQCNSCFKWLNIANTKNVTDVSNNSTKLIRVCPGCFVRIFSKYRESKQFKKYKRDYSRKLKDYRVRSLDKKDVEIIEAIVDNEKRIVKIFSVQIDDNLEHSYYLLDKDFNSYGYELLFKCYKCGELIRADDSRKIGIKKCFAINAITG